MSEPGPRDKWAESLGSLIKCVGRGTRLPGARYPTDASTRWTMVESKMNAVRMMCVAAAVAMVAGAPAYAQMSNGAMSNGSMSSGSMMAGSKKMSMSDKKMMTKCQGMDHDMMMKDKGCMKMMKMHPDMMKGHM